MDATRIMNTARVDALHPYGLTLTRAERAAMDWVGDRYAHGYDLYLILFGDCQCYPRSAHWDAECDITFGISEQNAWAIAQLLEGSGYDCFSSSLAAKLEYLIYSIV